jgi:hypothetical protein
VFGFLVQSGRQDGAASTARLEPHIVQFYAKFGNGAADISGENHASAVIHTIGLEPL